MHINFHQAVYFIRHLLVAKRKGHGVHSPFVYRLCEDVFYNHDTFYAFLPLNQVRNTLLKSTEVLEVEDFGAGSKLLKSKNRKVKDIAKYGISSNKQSELIYKLINFLNIKSCVELGTSLGINAQYMASVNTSVKVTTIEGSKALYSFAKRLAKTSNINNIEFINARFDEVLEELVIKQHPTCLVYIDGNHTYEATKNYFTTLLKYCNSNTVIVLDDIYWSKGMTEAWKEIHEHEKVTLSLDLFYFGIIFFKPEVKNKTHLRLVI